jgi:hypothetical protein
MAILALLLLASTALALGALYGRGNPKEPMGASHYPKGFSELANQANRFGGYFVNASDWFFYEGKTADFQEFAKKYVKIEGYKPRIEVIVGEGKPSVPFGKEEAAKWPKRYDWQLSLVAERGFGGHALLITLPAEGSVDLEKVELPPGIEIFCKEPNDAVKRFLERYKKGTAAT